MTAARSPAELARLFDDIGHQLASAADGTEALNTLAQVAADRVVGADCAGITIGRHGVFQTLGATSDAVGAVDRIQYDLGSGPCVDAIVEDTTYNASNLRIDLRWPEFGRTCAEQTGIISMLSVRFYLETDDALTAALNIYSHQPSAFDGMSELMAHLLATHGALAAGKASAQSKARNLEKALRNSREIGTAMGIVMAYEKVTRDEAFNLLRLASQHTHRKLADIAVDVVDTGLLPLPVVRQQG